MTSEPENIVIAGGSDAGISAALRARELSAKADVTLLVADRYPNFSICGLPFYLSGEVADWKTLAHRTVEEIESAGIHLLTGHRVVRFSPDQKQLLVRNEAGGSRTFSYDELIVATGAVSVRPDFAGMDLPGVFCLRWMQDAFAFESHLETRHPASIIIIGAGYIGMEMADAMTRRGLAVTVVEFAPNVLSTFDVALGNRVRRELEANGVSVYTGFSVERIDARGDSFCVWSESASVCADMVLVAAGSRPETNLAQGAGIALGQKGAIRVDRKMQTNLPHIYAAGDCAETYSRLTGKNTYLPLGTTAHKQGRVAGENAAGGNKQYTGTLGTQSVKIFNLVAARTGLNEDEAVKEGYAPLSVDIETWDHKQYYPQAQALHLRVTGDQKTHKLLGMQILGPYGKEVSKRLDTVATAIYSGMAVEDLNQLDLSYTPPLSSPWDPVQIAAQAWERSVRDLLG